MRPTNKSHLTTLVGLLKTHYPKARIVLNYSNNWELLVAVILSAQCTDVMVNKVTEKLFKKYKTVSNYANADLKDFEQDIRSTGFYKNKARNIKNSAKIILEKYKGQVPKSLSAKSVFSTKSAPQPLNFPT